MLPLLEWWSSANATPSPNTRPLAYLRGLPADRATSIRHPPPANSRGQAVRNLNVVRNRIAHKLEPERLDRTIDAFVNSVPSALYFSKDRQGRFEGALWSLFEAVSSLVERPTATIYQLGKGKDDV